MRMDIKELEKALLQCYSKDLCYPKVQDSWNENNKCFGMCAITSLIVNDYFGGLIGKICVNGISHYFNVVDNQIIDLTSSQFDNDIDYTNYIVVDRNLILTEDTTNRYTLLKERLTSKLLNFVDNM